MTDYHLFAKLTGHGNEVRGLSPYSLFEGGVCTCSFDKTVKLWRLSLKEGEDPKYVEEKTFVGHKDFVIKVLERNKQVVSISHDKTIAFFDVEKGEVSMQKKIHENNVSCMHLSRTTGLVYTGAWDKKGKIWKISTDGKDLELVSTLTGNQAYVLCILELENGDVVTGSGDANIKIFRGGKCVRTVKSHESCVRGLMNLPGLGFVSVSNDGYMNFYTNNGDKIDSFVAHENLIYNIDWNSKTQEIVSCSEDFYVKVWKNKKLIQAMEHPACIWDCAVLYNGDIACACADGNCYVWSRDAKRKISDDLMKVFDDDILKTKQRRSGIDPNKLGGEDALKEPGKKNGEIKLVNVGGRGKAYKWDAPNSMWELVGDLVEGPDSKQFSGKKYFEGEFYDFVFPVELEFNDAPGGHKYNIPYNMNQDPWKVAQDFIHKNNLAQRFLETIAKFIIKNSGQEHKAYKKGPIMDPFAQESKQLLTEKNDMEEAKKKSHFPVKNFHVISRGKWKAILKKILSFNGKIEAPELKMTTQEIAVLSSLVDLFEKEKLSAVSKEMIELMEKKLLKWEPKLLFPVLDLLRKLLLSERCAEHYKSSVMILVNSILKKCFDKSTTSHPLQLMGLKCVINVFSVEAFQKIIKFAIMVVLKVTKVCQTSKVDSVRLSYAKMMQSLVLLSDSGEKKVLIFNILCEALSMQLEMSNKTRDTFLYLVLQAIGTLLVGDNKEDVLKIAKEKNLEGTVKKIKSNDVSLVACKEQLMYFFQ